MWYVISGNDFADASVLYTLNLSNGELTVVGNIQNANFPAAFAIDCFGNAYVVNIEFAGFSTAAVFYSLNLTTAAATQIGTDLGLPDVSFGSQDMDFNPVDSTLYWAGYWIAGFSEGGSFRLIDVNNGTSTELGTYGQFETITGFSINANCVIPVELTSFSAKVINNSVSLDWSTATEVNNSGFDIERKSANSDWGKIGFVAGSGTTTEERSYSYRDNSLQSGSYTYRLKQIDYNGQFEYSNEVEVVINQPMEYSLDQNYPNPFNPSTTIRFSLPEASIVKIKVFNALGEEVASLADKLYEPGSHEIIFNAVDLTSGIYFVRMEAGAFISTKKITLMK
ncbi:MAG: T9SS type A sorting domain-containing protein [Ignavibacteriales bacterium]|nr:T9SS type A sorting domain-containing protein [Ignavibacteriales bacterium]